MLKKLPTQIPIFPLSGVIYFPKTNLPLNIFEQRYLDLVNDTLKKDKLMGMIQSKKENPQIYNVGCLGKISDFKRKKDGRILINLTGLIRFEILKEIQNSKLYREFNVNYNKFEKDLITTRNQITDEVIMKKVKIFFENNGLLLNWKEFEKLEQDQRINTLAMIAPVTNEEKQKLLETTTLQEKVETLEKIINFYLHNISFNNQTIQ
jgi:hypothetical protein